MKKRDLLVIGTAIILSLALFGCAQGPANYGHVEKEGSQVAKDTTTNESQMIVSPQLASELATGLRYQPAVATGDYVILYFIPEYTHNPLIPVSRLMPPDKKLDASTVVEALAAGPTNSLFLKPPFPEGARLIGTRTYEGSWAVSNKGPRYQGQIILLNFSREITNFPPGTPALTSIFSALEASLTDLPDVDAVGYLVEGQEVGSLGDPARLLRPSGPPLERKRTWIPLTFVQSKETFLVPLLLAGTDDFSLDMSLRALVGAVKNDIDVIKRVGVLLNRQNDAGEIWQQVPHLLSERAGINLVQREGETVLIDFNSQTATDLNTDPMNARIFLDAVVLSATELDGVKKVLITVEGKRLRYLGDIPLEEPLTRPKYVNPEKSAGS